MSASPPRVVVAANDLFVREGVQRILDQSGRVELVEGVADLPSLDAAVRSHRPDAVVTDVRLPPTLTDEGIRFASELRRDDPAVGVLVLSEDVSSAHATALFSGDAAGRGYLLKQRIARSAKFLEGRSRRSPPVSSTSTRVSSVTSSPAASGTCRCWRR